jgi:transposase
MDPLNDKRFKITVTLTPQEEETLLMWTAAGKTEQRMALRSRVILGFSQGKPLSQVSQELHLSKEACQKWRRRFQRQRLDGLKDVHRTGRHLSIPTETRARVISLACSTPSDGTSHWSMRRLAQATGLGTTTVHRILNQGRLKPNKVEYWCGKSQDPEFESKQAAILGLYLNPPENALVLSVDEKSQIQALDRTQPNLPMKPGMPRRQTADYKRHGTTSLLAALAVHQGVVEGRCIERHTHVEFLAFLKALYRKHPGVHLHIILDNLSAHKTKEVMAWVSRRRRLTLYFTPTHASWLNQIEIWFGIFSRDVLKGGVWHSKKELIEQILLYIRMYNQDRAHPFTWTYTGKVMAE